MRLDPPLARLGAYPVLVERDGQAIEPGRPAVLEIFLDCDLVVQNHHPLRSVLYHQQAQHSRRMGGAAPNQRWVGGWVLQYGGE